MKQQAASATRRGRALHDEAFPADFVRNAYMLAIRRAAPAAPRRGGDAAPGRPVAASSIRAQRSMRRNESGCLRVELRR